MSASRGSCCRLMDMHAGVQPHSRRTFPILGHFCLCPRVRGSACGAPRGTGLVSRCLDFPNCKMGKTKECLPYSQYINNVHCHYQR